ncbi:MAG: Ig-like domain-containing protein [Candidatus Eremiobacteraeota bacterium]|nr:Ig-like domain-containing protein [Candidatus Eremiobacteraeota bacterium]
MRYWIAFFFLIILCGCGGGGGGSSTGSGGGSNSNIPIPPGITLDRVEIVPGSAQLPLGVSLDFQLFAIYSNGVRINVTDAANFASSNTAVLSVNSHSARALTLGTAQITGRFEGQSSSAQVQTTEASLRSLALLPPTATVAAGLTQTYQVMATFSDSSEIDVTSSATLTVVDGSLARTDGVGRILSLRPGTTEVRASYNNQQASASLTVSNARLDRLEVTPSPVSIPVGLTQTFVATGYFSDGTHRDISPDVEWESSQPTFFFVSNLAGSKGQGGALAEGPAQVRASLGSVSANAQVTVVEAELQTLTVTPTGVELPVGLTQAFSAQGRFSDGSDRPMTDQVVWTSGNLSAATVSNVPGTIGVARAVQVGTTRIRAERGTVQADVELRVIDPVLQSIEVGPAGQSLPLGLTQQFSATGLYSDGLNRNISNLVNWSVSNSARASVDTIGLVTSLTEGTVDVQARLDNVEGKTLLTLSPAVLQDLTVTPSSQSLPRGATFQFDATGSFSDGLTRNLNNEVTWSSLQENFATVSNQAGSQGLVTGVNQGMATIQAQTGGFVKTAQVTVTAAVVTGVEIVPSNPGQPKGTLINLQVVARYSDGSVVDITSLATLSSDDGNIAEIRNNVGTSLRNTLYFRSTGSTHIQATSTSGNASTNVTVSEARLDSIEIVPDGGFLSTGQTQDLTALGHYGDGTIIDLTQEVSWSSLNDSTASISNAPGTRGRWTALATGEATLQATYLGVTGKALVRVNNDQQVGIDWVRPMGKGPQMFQVAFGNGLWVGTDLYRSFASPDGRNWRSGYLLTTRLANSTGLLAFGNGAFVADAGNNVLVRSNDGRNWTPVTLSTSASVRALAFGQNRFLAALSDNSVLASDDAGLTWTSVGSLNSGTRMEYANGRFFSLGSTTRVSGDGGASWTALTLPSQFQAASVIFDGSNYLLAGNSGRIYRTSDLVNYTAETVNGAGSSGFQKIVYGAGSAVAVDASGKKFASQNSQPWNQVGGITSTALGYRGDLGFLAAGGISPIYANPQLSSDGLNWDTLAPLNDDLGISDLQGVSYGPLGFFLSGLNRYWVSTDGVNWTARPTTGRNGSFSLVKYLGGLYYQVGSLGDSMLKVSTNGFDYSTRFFLPLGGQLAYGQGRYVFGGAGVSGSSNGLDWSPVANGSMLGAAYGGGRFVIVGNNQAAYSTNGITFTFVAVPGADLAQVEYAFGRFVAISGTQIWTSSDGAVWSNVTPAGGTTPFFRGLSVGNGMVVAYGAGIVYSRDAITWTRLEDCSFFFQSLTAGLGRFIGSDPGAGVITSP